jgi:hypothetical protein
MVREIIPISPARIGSVAGRPSRRAETCGAPAHPKGDSAIPNFVKEKRV